MPRPRPFFTRLRFATSAVSTLGLNLGLFGITARSVCSPGFYCHGCAWATFACPIGVIAYGSAMHTIPLLAIATVLAIGALVGRLVCSFVCPFGFLQDLLYRLPGPKFALPRWFRYGKYAALVLLVLLLPWMVGFRPSGYIAIDKTQLDKFGASEVKVRVTIQNPGTEPVVNPQLDLRYVALDNPRDELLKERRQFPEITVPPGQSIQLPEFVIPNMLAQATLAIEPPKPPEGQPAVLQWAPYHLYYCKVCPVGTLTATVPTYFKKDSPPLVQRMKEHWLKLSIAGLFLGLMVFSSRPLCRLFCPLGACYALAAPLAVTGMKLDESACVGCRQCDKVCPVGLDVAREVGSAECVACGDCMKVCAMQGISRTFGLARARQGRPALEAIS